MKKLNPHYAAIFPHYTKNTMWEIKKEKVLHLPFKLELRFGVGDFIIYDKLPENKVTYSANFARLPIVFTLPKYETFEKGYLKSAHLTINNYTLNIKLEDEVLIEAGKKSHIDFLGKAELVRKLFKKLGV